jgi:hypothetical protein
VSEDPKVLTESAFIALLLNLVGGSGLYWLVASLSG